MVQNSWYSISKIHLQRLIIIDPGLYREAIMEKILVDITTDIIWWHKKKEKVRKKNPLDLSIRSFRLECKRVEL